MDYRHFQWIIDILNGLYVFHYIYSIPQQELRYRHIMNETFRMDYRHSSGLQTFQ